MINATPGHMIPVLGPMMVRKNEVGFIDDIVVVGSDGVSPSIHISIRFEKSDPIT